MCLYHHRRFGIENTSATSPNTRSHNKAEVKIHIDAHSDSGHELRKENSDKVMTKALGTKRVSHTNINSLCLCLNLCRQIHYKPMQKKTEGCEQDNDAFTDTDGPQSRNALNNIFRYTTQKPDSHKTKI